MVKTVACAAININTYPLEQRELADRYFFDVLHVHAHIAETQNEVNRVKRLDRLSQYWQNLRKMKKKISLASLMSRWLPGFRSDDDDDDDDKRRQRRRRQSRELDGRRPRALFA